jgi:glycosyltransferase involved in cell wall biosynthesis
MKDLAVPEVSIITITKNRADLLKRAINSVLGQTFINFEYLIVDGGSTDHTAEIVESFADKRIIYLKLREDLESFSHCVDYAMGYSRGKFITFLDDDDEYLPSKIEKQYNLLISLPEDYGMVYCWMDYYDDNTGKLIQKYHPENRGYIYYECIEKQSMGGTPTLFLHKKAFNEVKGFNKELKYASDWEFNTRVARKYLIDFVPEVLVKVHVNHPFLRMTQTSTVYSKEVINSHIDFYEYYLSEFKDGFNKYPKKKLTHLIRLSKLYSRLGDSVKSKGLMLQIIKEFGFSYSVLVTIIKSIYLLNFKLFR